MACSHKHCERNAKAREAWRRYWEKMREREAKVSASEFRGRPAFEPAREHGHYTDKKVGGDGA